MTKTREQWLTTVANTMAPQFNDLGYDMPKFRISCGFPSQNATARKNRRIGECWVAGASDDQTHEILISPVLIDTMEIAGVVAHELIHAVLPDGTGHKGKFPSICKSLGLDGKPSATTPGDAFKRWCQPILDKVGDYPHARLNAASKPKKQGTRMIKCECPDCGYVVRTTAKWLQHGAPLCPDGTEMVY